VAGLTGNPSPTWAVEDSGDVADHTHGRGQAYSVRHLQQYYYGALTSASDSDRRTYFGLVLRSLGHVVHHIQDMAQPQHVRNDQHVHPIPYTDYYPQWSFYERYSERVLTPVRVATLANAANYPVPTFQTSREFWHTPGATSGRYTGMAEFTANNYVSYGKSFHSTWRPDGVVDIFPHPLHPLPGPYNADGTLKSVTTQNVTVTLTDGSQRTGAMDFVVGKVYDANYGGMIANQRLASVSVLDMLAASESYGMWSGKANVFKENSAIYDDQHRILLPRAVAYSTGLINHMFRGRLDLARTTPTSRSYTVTNLSRTFVAGAVAGQRINGMMTLYYDDASGVRRMMPGASWQSVDLAYGASVNVGDTEAPAGAQRIVAVFHGRIGGEGEPFGNPSTGYIAVAGKAIQYTGATLPCGVPIKAEGSAEGLSQSMDLGSLSARVYGEFEAYGVPDKLVVRRLNASGPVLYTTGSALVPGYHTFNFQHTGSSDPAQNRIHVQVTGNQEYPTWWTVAVGCPGQTLGNQDRVKPRIRISFGHTSSGGAGCAYGHFRIFMNGTEIGRVNYGEVGGSGGPIMDVTAGSDHSLRLLHVLESSGQSVPGCQLGYPYVQTSAGQRDIRSYIGNVARAITLP
jgi:hypothetical protein